MSPGSVADCAWPMSALTEALVALAERLRPLRRIPRLNPLPAGELDGPALGALIEDAAGQLGLEVEPVDARATSGRSLCSPSAKRRSSRRARVSSRAAASAGASLHSGSRLKSNMPGHSPCWVTAAAPAPDWPASGARPTLRRTCRLAAAAAPAPFVAKSPPLGGTRS